MRRSYEHQGIGAELILTVFKEILVSCKAELPLSQEQQCLSEDQFVEHVMRSLSFPDRNNHLYQFITEGMKQVAAEEALFISNAQRTLEEKKSQLHQKIVVRCRVVIFFFVFFFSSFCHSIMVDRRVFSIMMNIYGQRNALCVDRCIVYFLSFSRMR